jgi:NB-ARC domain
MESREQGTGSGADVVNTINLDRAFVFGSRFNQGSLTNLFHGDHASQAPPAPVKDEWIGGERSLPSREGFMVGPEKLQSVADLRQAVLDCEEGGVVAAVGAHGMGGVGKSIACLLVAKDRDVREKYSDATLWINLGLDATDEVVVDQMAAVVEHTGGAWTARLMRDMFSDHGAQILGAIKGKARDWFYGRRVLLVLDD